MAFAAVQVNALAMGLKHEWAPSTPAQSSQAVHVASGHAAWQLPLPGLENGAEVGHDVQLPAPLELYCPTAHITAVALVDPAGHAYPALHAPSHSDHDDPALPPYSPAGQFVQDPAEACEYVPAAHSTAVAFVEPGGLM